MSAAPRIARAVAGAAACAVLVTAACTQPRSALAPRGPAARELAALGWPVLVGFTVTSAVMWGLIAWVARRRTGSLEAHAPVEAPGGKRWILFGGILVPGFVFASLFFTTLYALGTFPMEHEGSGQAEIRVVGRQWFWEVHYLVGGVHEQVVTANEIHIPSGRPVEIELETRDVIHSFWVPSLHGKVDLIPGVVNRIRVQADYPGEFAGGCAEYCGLQHARMRFVVVADEPGVFERWLARQRLPAAAPATESARRGEQVFVHGACAMCHTIRGTEAKGSVGPDLTHLADRRTIAGASLPNHVATLRAWVADAQSLKPGAKMPTITQLSGGELGDVVEYLQTLK